MNLRPVLGMMQALNRGHVREFNPSRKSITGAEKAEQGPYEALLAHRHIRPNPVCHCRRHFAANGTARFAGLKHDRLDLRQHQQAGWRRGSPQGLRYRGCRGDLASNDPEGVAFEYEVIKVFLYPTPELPDDTPLECVRFSTRIQNALEFGGLKTVGEARTASDAVLLSFQGLGRGSVQHLRQTLGPSRR
jgi:RNA polymerase alpha subunit